MIYLDNAATSFPKPLRVCQEVQRCLTEYGGNPGRGAHALSLAAAERVYACREALSDFLGLGAPERVIFTHNTTDALNVALKGFLTSGAHVLVSDLEHNAVRRPLCRLQREGRISFEQFPVLGLCDAEILTGIRTRIKKNTVAVVCTHTSNVCSVTLPVRKIGALCKSRGLRFILDAAQSAGHLPLNMREMQIDALAAPGHKGLYGIQGAGVLALGARFDPLPLLEGGGGVDSLAEEMPDAPPERYEAGTLPTPAIAALLCGVEFLRDRGVEEIHAKEVALFLALRERLQSLPGIHVYAPEHAGAVLLFHSDRLPAVEVGRLLSARGICVRAGYHCAPTAHMALGTPPGGAVRVSFGCFNTLAEIDALWRVLADVQK